MYLKSFLRSGGYGRICIRKWALDMLPDNMEEPHGEGARWTTTSHVDVIISNLSWGGARREASRRRVAAGKAARTS
jgi:hypothetical protein